MYDNEFETKENKIWTKDKIEPQHLQIIVRKHDFNLTRDACVEFELADRHRLLTKARASEEIRNFL